MDENVITVTGKGAIHVIPDVTRLELTLQSIHDSYEEAYEQAKANTEKLGKVMSEVKLDSKLPKTIRLDIDKETVNEYDKYKNYTGQKFIGFALDHRVKIDIGMDNVLLNSIVKLIGQMLKQAEINICYTVRDTRPSQLRMLERAVTDAKDKAEIMANACGCKLGLVKNINYTVHELKIFSQARMIHGADEAACCNKESLDITPDDLEVSDNVTVEWYLCNSIKNDE
ncbi:MAG: SIMPL domain-containing protein [Prevotella sp.]|nr:SIMPL domain-containing protein [Prevotella sp.]